MNEIHNHNGTITYSIKMKDLMIDCNFSFQVYNFLEILICVVSGINTIKVLRTTLSKYNYLVIFVFMFCIIARWTIFLWYFIDKDQGNYTMVFVSKESENKGMNIEDKEKVYYMHKVFVNIINLVIVFNMFLFIL